MNPLEIRLIAYTIAALVLLGGSGFVGYRVTANHYEALMARDRASQDKALQEAQQSVIAAQAAQAQAIQKAETQYAYLKAHSDDLARTLASSVQQYAQIHSGLVSATSSTAALTDATRQSAQRTGELTELVQQAASACADDSARLTALQTWASALRR